MFAVTPALCQPTGPSSFPVAEKQVKALKKGKTLQQIEEEEGGPVSERHVRVPACLRRPFFQFSYPCNSPPAYHASIP
jgi:hypothetical protein